MTRAVSETLDAMEPQRLGHGVRAVEDPRVLDRVVAEGVALEVCPLSNVSLGVFDRPEDVPLRTLVSAGARVALGADDPLIFGSRLADQYATARLSHGFTDEELAALARASLAASRAPSDVRAAAERDIARWLQPTSGRDAANGVNPARTDVPSGRY